MIEITESTRTKKNIYILIDSLAGGGAERLVVTLSNHLYKRGYHVSVLTLFPPEKDLFVLSPGVERKYLILPERESLLRKFVLNIKRINAVRAIIKRERADLLVGVMTNCAIISIMAGFGLATKVLITERNYPGRKNVIWIWFTLRRLLYRLADKHVAQTKQTAEWIQSWCSVRDVCVIPNSVTWPLSRQEPIIDPFDALPDEKKYVLAVGTKVKQKGFDLLLEAFSMLVHEIPNWNLVIVGIENIENTRWGEDQTRGLGVRTNEMRERVHFTGTVGNIGSWYERADLFVLSSRYEGFPNALLEAMAAGCACVAFDCDTGPREIIEHRVNGLLVPAEDVTGLAMGMRNMMLNDCLRLKMGEKAKAITEHFGEQRIMTEWCRVISKLV